MRATAMKKKPYQWGLGDLSTLDPDFDDVDGFEAEAIENIHRNGMLALHPNGWGVHDYYGVNTGTVHHTSAAPIGSSRGPDARVSTEEILASIAKQDAARESRRSAIRQATRVVPNAERDLQEGLRFNWAASLLEAFPHATNDIAWQVATEFSQFGHEDARRRSITDDEWVWKRSRFLAGFK